MEVNLLIALAGILGAGLSSWVGVRVAMTQIEGRLNSHDGRLIAHDRRLDRLESPFFREDRERDS